MPEPNEDLVRAAYAAYCRGDVDRMLTFVDQDLEWTYLPPGAADPGPQTCRGRGELARAVRRNAASGLVTRIEEITGHGDQVLVVLRTVPGEEAAAAGAGGAVHRELTHMVVTVREGRIVALRACRDRAAARGAAGLA